MKHFLLFLFLSATFFYAQPVTSDDSTASLPMQRGQWAIQFQVTNNFTLSHFNGANFAAKYHFSERSALRLAVSAAAEDKTLDERQAYYFDEIYDGDYLTKKSSGYDFDITIEPQYIYYITYKRNPAVYLGAGLTFGLNMDESKLTYDLYQDLEKYSREFREIEISGFSLGISALAGVEIFLNEYLSLHAEYASSFTYSSDDTKDNRRKQNLDSGYERVTNTNYSDEKFRLRYESVLLGLSVYF
jgi:hypothetical protein